MWSSSTKSIANLCTAMHITTYAHAQVVAVFTEVIYLLYLYEINFKQAICIECIGNSYFERFIITYQLAIIHCCSNEW